MKIFSIQSSLNDSRGPNLSTTEQLQRSIDSNDPSIKKTLNSFQIQNQTMKTTEQPTNKSLLRVTCPGSLNPTILPLTIVAPSAKKPVSYFEPTTKILPKPDSLSKLLQIHPQASPQLNRNKSLKEMWSTSIKSLHHFTMLFLMKREWVTWETQRLCLKSLTAKNESLLPQNGLQLGKKLPKPLDSSFPTVKMNYLNTEITLNANSPPNSFPHITKLFSMTLHSRTKLLVIRLKMK
jgi:hypothetical protein